MSSATNPVKRGKGACDRRGRQTAKRMGDDQHPVVRTTLTCELLGETAKVIPIRGHHASPIRSGLLKLLLIRPGPSPDLMHAHDIDIEAARNYGDFGGQVLIEQKAHRFGA